MKGEKVNIAAGELPSMFFDTHVAVKKLQESGFTEQQAEAQTEMISSLIEKNLATKRDLKELENATKRDLKELEARVKGDIIKWVAGLLLAQTGVIVGMIAALIKLL